MNVLKVVWKGLSSPYAMLTMMAIFWAGNAIVGRLIIDLISPLSLSFWRWVVATLILVPFTLHGIKKTWPAVKKQWPVLLLLSLSSVSAYNTIYYLALQTTTVINTTLIATSMPIFLMLLSWLWLREKLNWKSVIGIGVSLLGVILVVTAGNPWMIFSLELHHGDLLVLLAALSWAFYSALLKKSDIGINDPLVLLSILVIIGTLCLLPVYIWEVWTYGGFVISWQTLGGIGYVALFPSVLSYYFWVRGVQEIGPTSTGQFIYLVPPFAALMAVLFIDEAYYWYHAVSLCLILSGIWIGTLWARKKQN